MITAIIQARVGSTRLPNKVFADLAGHPLIWHVVNRALASREIEKVVLATTVNPMDDALADWADKVGVALFRGDEADVLARFHGAATAFGATTIVRITADDPFKDPRIIDRVIRLLESEGLAFTYNNKPPSFPEGLDTEVFTMEALDRAHRNATLPFDREHVTQFMFRDPVAFPQKNLSHGEDLSRLRWTVDTALDLRLAEEVYACLYREGSIFQMEDILALIALKPELGILNAEVPRSAMYQGSKGVNP